MLPVAVGADSSMETNHNPKPSRSSSAPAILIAGLVATTPKLKKVSFSLLCKDFPELCGGEPSSTSAFCYHSMHCYYNY